MAKRRKTFDLTGLPKDRRIKAYHDNGGGTDLMNHLGLTAQDVGSPAESNSKPKTKAGKKSWVGSISFDSQTEANVYRNLTLQYPAIIAHGKIALSESETKHIEPDFIIVKEVYPDGSFLGVLADAKAVWGDATKPHIERDWEVKRRWLKDKFGLETIIVTKDSSHLHEASSDTQASRQRSHRTD